MKKVIISSLVAIMILFVQQIWAQRSPERKIDHLKTELNLSDDQVEQLEQIFESKHEEMKSLRGDEEKTREEKRAAMEDFRATINKEIENVLNEDQLTKFQEIKKERHGEHGRRGHRMGFHKKFKDGKGRELHAQIKAYKDENIKPVMLEQRAKLEPKISESDKQLIAELRVEFEKNKAKREAHFKEMKQNCESGNKKEGIRGRHMHGDKRMDDETHEKMKGLVERYQKDIEPLFEEVADQQEKWKNDIKEITKNTLGLDSEEIERGMRRMKRHHVDRMEKMKMGRFLLLDPNEESNANEPQSLIREISAFPNPASSVTTIEYDVLEKGQVMIELRDRKGKLLKTVKNEIHEKGKYSVTILLESYKSDLFYVVIKDKNGVSATKNIVRVR